jgi:colicin import membrane protein
MTAATMPPRPQSREPMTRSFALALAMHALLFAALWVGVQWRTAPQPEVVAELWTLPPNATVIGPTAQPKPPEPQPVPQPAPQPVPPPPAPPQTAEPPRPDADIVQQQLKQKKLAEEKRQQELAQKKAQEEQQRKAEEARRAAEARAAEEKRQQEALKKAQEEQQRKAEEAKRAAAAKAAEERAAQQREALRQAEQKRMQSQAGAATGTSQTGASTGAAGDATYAAQIAALIKRHIEFAVPEGTSRDVFADFKVDLLPTGEIMSVKLVKPSGLAGYDAAVERAINRSQPFPRQRDGKVPPSLPIRLYPIER